MNSNKTTRTCPRTLPKALDPVKKPTMNCVFRKELECSLHPDYNNYLKTTNHKKWFSRTNYNEELTLKVRCVLYNEFGMSVSEQRDYDKASARIQREELAMCKRDSKILESIKNQVLPEFFSDLEYELEESEHWLNLRIVDEPTGDLQYCEDICFKIHIDQHSVGDSGDSYSGTVCIELPWGKYLIWDFWM